jgi:putative ABC transport system substrate-binding protein
MQRRTFMALVSGGLLAVPLAAEAQQVERGRVPRIGMTMNPASDGARAFEEGLRNRGYVPNRNLMIEYRFSSSKPELTPEVIDELVRLTVDVFVVGNNLAALAVRRAAPTTPIVVAVATNPVDAGIAQSLAHPGGTITGLTWEAGPEMWGKSLNLFRDMFPRGSRIAILWNAASPIPQPYLEPTEEAAKKLGVPLVHSPIQSPEELERAFALMVEGRPRGVLVVGDPVLYRHRSRVNELAMKARLASMWGFREGVESGGLMSYGVSFPDLFRRAAGYVDKILKGAKPGDLPMEQPSKFELVINLKTAKELGLTIPPSLLLRADEVIQ